MSTKRKETGTASPNPQSLDRRPLYGMFSKVPARYDFLNRLFTLGMDQRWRKVGAEICLKNNPRRVMDLCSGTGDLAIELAKIANTDTEIFAADFCEPMLELAKQKAKGMNLADRIKFRVADAAELPYDDNYFDVVGIAFGFRNLTFKNPRTDSYLKEIFRVIAPGGKFVIIETSQPKSILLKKPVHFYLTSIVSPVGKLISKHPNAYSYLAYSAKNYFKPDQIIKLLSDVGFEPIKYKIFWHGIAAIHVANVPTVS